MKIGDNVKVIKRRWKVLDGICVGMEGNIYESETYNGRQFFHIRATNKGLLMNGGKKMVYAWLENNHGAFLEEELLLN